jgi:hypothetical protein
MRAADGGDVVCLMLIKDQPNNITHGCSLGDA